ncbi:MAG: hypothetical protein AVDCRST_MAG93-5361 [uncultured Chloroflexia bacterium]|uniref:Uncharacterized protein n=1 Tax=uncultured Chloroflexia bacterium TaxID=1672391 RepID=A0A6J4KRV8_9CHLR|nr:MAG: hypothetical protein AVDCRST_MAG93-5361 [uncultured Chloroflexia bacterium]
MAALFWPAYVCYAQLADVNCCSVPCIQPDSGSMSYFFLYPGATSYTPSARLKCKAALARAHEPCKRGTLCSSAGAWSITVDRDVTEKTWDEPTNQRFIVRCACQDARVAQAARLKVAFGIGELCAALVVLSSLRSQLMLWLGGVFLWLGHTDNLFFRHRRHSQANETISI